MAKNQQLAALLTGLNNNPHLAANPGYKDALDTLLRADHTNANAFRAALFAHKAVWIAISGGALVDADFPQNDATNIHFDATDNTQGQQFVDLYQLAAQKRVELALMEANAAALNAIITANAQAVRQQLGASPLSALVGNTAQWHGGLQPNNQNHLTDNAVLAIQQAAKQALLIQKIKAASGTDQTRQHLEALLDASANNNDANFRAAAAQLGISDAQVLNALTANLLGNGNQLEKVALRKAFELRVQHQFAVDFHPIDNAYAALDRNRGDFNPFIGVYNNKFNRNDEDANWAKGILGAKYLKEALAVHDNADDLIRIAAAAANPAVATLQGAIGPLFDGGTSPYVVHAVTDANAKELRQIAAVQALKLNIAACSDAKALKALADVRDIGSLRSVLDKYPALGFSGAGNVNAREALVESSILRSILGQAHVRAHLPSASTNHLKTLVAQANFATHYKQYLVSASEPPLVSQALDDYFNTPANVAKSREEALIALLRANVKQLSIDELNAIARVQSINELQNSLKINQLMGVGNAEADDLIHAGATPDFVNGLRGLAKAELLARAAKAADMGAQAQFNAVISYINTLSQDGTANNTQTWLQALSPSDQNNLRKQLIEILIDHYPLGDPGPDHAPIVRLNDLIQATDTNDVKVKLANMRVTVNLDWVDDSFAADLQKKAAARAANGHIDDYSAFPAEAHPHLQAFLSHLTLDKQKAILAKPEVLGALMKVKSLDDIRRVVGTTNSSASALIAENKQLNQLTRIVNPALAASLAKVIPPLALSDAQVNSINSMLIQTINMNPDTLFNQAHYPGFVANLRHTLQPSNRAAFNAAFGMDAQGNAITDDRIRQAIRAQHTYNGPLIDMVANNNPGVPTAKEKKAIELLMAISKQTAYPQNELTLFVTQLDTSNTHADFIAALPRVLNGVNQAIIRHFNAGWQQQITPELFDAYKQVKKQQAWLDARYNAPNGTKATEQTEVQALKTKLQSITAIDKHYRDELKHLGNLTHTQWLSPEFEVSARQAYNELQPKFKAFARDCDIILEELRRQQKIYEDKLYSLPDTSTLAQGPQKKDIDNFRKQLKEELKNIENGIVYYEKASRALSGDPSATDELARKGLIQHLEDCKQGTNVIFATSDMSYSDFPVDEKERHFAQGYQPGPGQQAAPDRSALSTEAPRTYTVKKLEPGMCREYVMTGKKQATVRGQKTIVDDVGTFIEEVHAGHLDPKTVNKKTEVNPKATITVAQFPGSAVNQIKYSMAMASQLLAHLDHAPTKDRPIVITGSNPEELRHLWTALMVLGKNNPKMKFDQDAIKVASTAFDPTSELGKVYGLKKEALYNTYMAHPTIKQMVGLIKTFTESKEAEKGTTKDVTKKIASMLQQFKTEGKETLDNLGQDLNTNRGPTLG